MFCFNYGFGAHTDWEWLEGLSESVLLQVRGAGHYLPEYAGNLDIMTSAALATAERMYSK